MPNVPYPGINENGFGDATLRGLPPFASTAARDAWVTSIGGTGVLPNGFACYITATNVICVWNGAWRSTAALA